jgi:anaerobic selenocysteine-containing dehydrogenase
MNGAVAFGAEAIAAIAVLRGFVPRTGGGRGARSVDATPVQVGANASPSLPSID